MFIAIQLSACGSSIEESESQNKPRSTVSVSHALIDLSASKLEGVLSAHITVDNDDTQYDMTSDGEFLSVQINNVTDDLHSFHITLEFTPAGESTFELATDSVDADTRISTEVSFPGTSFKSTDDDGNGFSNLKELTNQAPVADAGPDQTARLDNTVVLNGSASSDPDGDALTYFWSLQTPENSSATLSNITTPNPNFVMDITTANSEFVGTLIVNDGLEDSVANQVIISAGNVAPIANAGPDQAAIFDTTVNLDASLSSDLNGDNLTYAWSFISRPAGSSASLTSTNSVTTSFTVDSASVGVSYEVQLVVNDGTTDSTADTIVISTDNVAPVANAGPDQIALLNTMVNLDGSDSSDVNGDSVTYNWSLVSVPPGSNAGLLNANSVNPSFMVDVANVGVNYTVQLIVNDGITNSAADTVVISTGNIAPVANAGADKSAVFNQTVILDGGNSTDINGDALTYKWSLIAVPAGSSTALLNPDSVSPSFIVNDSRIGVNYVAQLIVNDGIIDSGPDTIVISTGNVAPVANAGPDQVAVLNASVNLDGSASSDANGDNLTYLWSLTSLPSGSSTTIINPTSVNPSFVVDVADVDVNYVVQLIVNDNITDSAPDTVTISTGNIPPVANAGTDQTAVFNDTVNLNAGNSQDANGNSLTYKWSLISRPAGSNAVLVNPASQTPSFIVDVNSAGVNYIAQLIVNDGSSDSFPDTVIVSTGNIAPLANAGLDMNVSTGTSVTLDGGNSTDINGDQLVYQWSLTGKPFNSNAQLQNANANGDTPSFVADLAGNYVAQLVVNDGTVSSQPDSIMITAVSPVATIANYPFSGNANDISGNGLHGTVDGAVPGNDRFGNSSSAYIFNGVDSSINIPFNPLFNITDKISLSAWVFPTQQKTQEIIRFGAAVNGSSAAPYSLAMSGTGDIVFSLRPGLVFTQARKTGYTLNTWTHIVGTYDGSSMRLYVNGNLETTINITGALNTSTSEMLIGTRLKLAADTFQGAIDEVRIYDSVLTATEISTMASQ